MPELPENETQRRTLERECLDRTIEMAELGDDISYIELPGSNELGRLKGRQFTETRRHGKNIFAGSKSGPWITVHLGMSGRLIPFDAPDDPPDHTKFLITFEGNRRLAFRCPRKLGHVKVIDDPDAYIEEQGFGPDALDIAKAGFCEAIGGTRSTIKSALMAQEKLAGIGNLWSDEILFHIGVGPERRANELSVQELEDAFETMRDLLGKGVEVEADYSQLPDTWLVRNRDERGSCPRRGCGGTIRRTRVAGRSAYHCDTHQS